MASDLRPSPMVCLSPQSDLQLSKDLAFHQTIALLRLPLLIHTIMVELERILAHNLEQVVTGFNPEVLILNSVEFRHDDTISTLVTVRGTIFIFESVGVTVSFSIYS